MAEVGMAVATVGGGRGGGREWRPVRRLVRRACRHLGRMLRERKPWQHAVGPRLDSAGQARRGGAAARREGGVGEGGADGEGGGSEEREQLGTRTMVLALKALAVLQVAATHARRTASISVMYYAYM